MLTSLIFTCILIVMQLIRGKLKSAIYKVHLKEIDMVFLLIGRYVRNYFEIYFHEEKT